MPYPQRKSKFTDDFHNQSLNVSSVEKLRLLSQVAGAHTIRFEGPEEMVVGEEGMVFKRFVRIRNGEPIRAEGLTIEAAEENVANQIITKLNDGSIIFNTHHQLEFHKQHESKFNKGPKKKR